MIYSKGRNSLVMTILIISSIFFLTGLTFGIFARGSPGDDQEEAMPVLVNTVYAQSFASGDLEDWWKIQIFTGETCRIFVNLSTPGLVADLKAYNESLSYVPKNLTETYDYSGGGWYDSIKYGSDNVGPRAKRAGQE